MASLTVAVSLVALGAAADGLPAWLQPTEIDISKDMMHEYGESHIAVNPTNPGNLLGCWVKDSITEECLTSGDPNCQLVNRVIQDPPLALPIGPGPVGYFEGGPRFVENGVFYSFDHGKTWTRVEIPLFPPDHPEFINQGDASCTVGPDGTFYVSWDALNWNDPLDALPNGGIAVSLSTDGGVTWSEPVLTGTALDGPKIFADPNTGRVYAASSGGLGRLATANPSDPGPIFASPNDRFVAASSDGVSWTTPHGFGGLDGATYRSAGFADMEAANGQLAVVFLSPSDDACNFFVGTAAPCIVFQTSMDDGATWSRHAVPATDVVATTRQSVMVAADPSTPGHFAVAGPNASNEFRVYDSYDSGATWSAGTTVSDPAPYGKFFAWMTYSHEGILGLMWRAATEADGIPWDVPFLVWAAISDDGGATFYDPIQVSAAPSPPAPLPGLGPGDDYSHIAFATTRHQGWLVKILEHVKDPRVKVVLRKLFGPDRLYVTWADRRPGARAAFLGTVKLWAFRRPANQ